MTKEIKILRLENRIALLESRTKRDNGKVIAKLKRQLRAAAGPESV